MAIIVPFTSGRGWGVYARQLGHHPQLRPLEADDNLSLHFTVGDEVHRLCGQHVRVWPETTSCRGVFGRILGRQSSVNEFIRAFSVVTSAVPQMLVGINTRPEVRAVLFPSFMLTSVNHMVVVEDIKLMEHVCFMTSFQLP